MTLGCPKIVFNVIFVEGRQGYQMLAGFIAFSKSQKYIQLPCFIRDYLEILNFDT